MPSLSSNLTATPDPSSDLLRTQLCEQLGVDKTEIVVGNGSDELIGNFMLAFQETGGVCLLSNTDLFDVWNPRASCTARSGWIAT